MIYLSREDASALMETEKQGQESLAGITSTSKAGVWTQLKYVMAVLCEILGEQLKRWLAEVDALVSSQRWATVPWYIETAKKYQVGDMLVLNDNGTYSYAATDITKQIIAQAAIDVVDRELRLKVATEVNGELAKVLDEDMPMFRSYIEQVKRPGTIIRYINFEADLLRMSLRIWFDGELIEYKLSTAIRTAVKDYLKTIVFNGVFSVTKMIDRIQEIDGVNEVSWLWGTCRSASQPADTAQTISARYKAASGYFKLDTVNNEDQLNIELIRES